jgi:uncharacterized protein
MPADELTKPLGLPSERRTRRIPIVALVAPPLAVVVGLAIYFAVGGEPGKPPSVVAKIDGAAPDQTGSIAPAPASPVVQAPPTTGLVEVKPTGHLDEVGNGDVIITDPSKPRPIRLAAAPREDLTETSAYGLLPRIGDDGTRPLDAYARPAASDDTAGLRRVAIVIGGIGVEGGASEAAITGLPGAVTLAFAPYGDELPATVADARASGHEILIQVPMEPYNYPDIDPGPRTLTVDGGTTKNLDRLHWVLSRITTYVGVMNYMGAQFTGDDKAMAPVIGDVVGRGLLYLDDGSSARSRALSFAAPSAPVLEADLVIDADISPAAIDAKLDQLAAIAADRGYAIATGTAFPTTVERVAAFAKAAERRGLLLVPVSDLVRSDRS